MELVTDETRINITLLKMLNKCLKEPVDNASTINAIERIFREQPKMRMLSRTEKTPCFPLLIISEPEEVYVNFEKLKPIPVFFPVLPFTLLYQPEYTPLDPLHLPDLNNFDKKNRKDNCILLGHLLNLKAGKKLLGPGLAYFYKHKNRIYIKRTDRTNRVLFLI